jgi:alpha-aminoadipate carrier protein LysW
MAICPECDAEIEVDEYDVDKGDLLSCPECGSNLVIAGLTPIELDVASDEDDDDDEDDDEEEEKETEVTDELDLDEAEETEEEEDWDE